MRRPTHFFAFLAVASLAACTTETIVSPTPAPGPSTSLPEEAPPETEKPPDPVEDPAWREVKPLGGELRQLSCPTDTEVHAATSTGLYRLEGEAWKAIAPGDFYGVSMPTATSGFAGGEGVFVRRAGSEWAALDGVAKWKVRAVHTSSEGAYVGGSGHVYAGNNQFPIEPKLWFVANDLTLRNERAYGSRLTAGSITSISGSGASVVIGGGRILETWSGTAWEPAPSDYFLVGGYKSVAMIAGYAFATNGQQIVEPGGSRYNPVGGGPDIAHLFAYKTNLFAVGAAGTILRRAPDGDYETIRTDEPVDLTAGCATSAGTLWVAGGKRVFRRRDVIR